MKTTTKELGRRTHSGGALVAGVVLALAAGAGWASCSDQGGFQVNELPHIDVLFNQTVVLDGDVLRVQAPAAAALGGAHEAAVGTLTLSNTGQALSVLDVTGIAVTSEPPGLFRLEVPAGAPGALPSQADPWRLAARELDTASSQADSVTLAQLQALPRSLQVRLLMRAPDAGADARSPIRGAITIDSDSGDGLEHLTLSLQVDRAAPRLQVLPGVVDFGVVAQGQEASKTLTLTNVGGASLTVDAFSLQGAPGFALVDGTGVWTPSNETVSGVTLPQPIVLDPGRSHALKVRFTPDTPEAAQGLLRLFSDDPETGVQGAPVVLQANLGGPCISVSPTKIDFGGKLVGQAATMEVAVTSCGDAPLEIRGLRLLSDAEVPDVSLSTDFTLDLGGLADSVPPGTQALTESDAPVVLPVGVDGARTFTVTYVPDAINPLDDAQQPIPDLGVLQILTNTAVPEVRVDVRGFGVDTQCPTAVIKVLEGEEVIPQTKLHLVGSQSYGATGAVHDYQWSVEQPAGAQDVFIPDATAADPTFRTNVAGIYTFRLEVWDDAGVRSCEPAEVQVLVVPDEAIHVELLWNTPADPDQTDEGDEAGADVDLHFTHPFAVGEDLDGDGVPEPYFSSPFDCFFMQPEPDWPVYNDAADDPSLDRDDLDGAGPENINMDHPHDGLTYRVGVHYWDDHGFGDSYATVRVYIHSVLVFERQDVLLVERDLWDVATIAWPSGAVTPLTDGAGGPRIIPAYNPTGFSVPLGP